MSVYDDVFESSVSVSLCWCNYALFLFRGFFHNFFIIYFVNIQFVALFLSFQIKHFV